MTQRKATDGKTLEELERDMWPAPEFGSHLVTTCHALRKKRIDRFEVEDFRILIGQGIGLDHLAPVVMEMLETDPLLEGDFFPGDVLEALRRSRDWFDGRPAEAVRGSALIERAQSTAVAPKDLFKSGSMVRWLEAG